METNQNVTTVETTVENTTPAVQEQPSGESAAQQAGAASAELTQDGASQDSAGSPEQPAAEERPAERAPQSREENRRFADMRRREETFRQLMGDTINPDTGKPFANSSEFMGWRKAQQIQQQAKQAGMTPEVFGAVREQMRQEILASDPQLQQERERLQRYEQQEAEQCFAKDLAAIKKAFPDEKAKHISELGDEFMAMMASGKVSAVAAYRAIREQRQLDHPAPKSMGDVGGSGGTEKEYYTPDEVKRMSKAEISKNFDKIRRSMTQWK